MYVLGSMKRKVHVVFVLVPTHREWPRQVRDLEYNLFSSFTLFYPLQEYRINSMT